jgi:hypothetical protein
MSKIKYPMTVEELNGYLADPKHSTLTVAILWLTQNLDKSRFQKINPLDLMYQNPQHLEHIAEMMKTMEDITDG